MYIYPKIFACHKYFPKYSIFIPICHVGAVHDDISAETKKEIDTRTYHLSLMIMITIDI